MIVKVVVTKHALERLFERFPKHKKFEAKTIENVFESIIKDGIVTKLEKEIRISTNNYTLCCVLNGNNLIIKTVLRTKELGKSYRKILMKGKKSEWKNLIFESKKLEKLCKKIEKLKEVCKICGISKNQTFIERCNIYGFFICQFCCISIGGGHEECKGCPFDPIPRKDLEKSSCYII